jgi:hypothetical protein
MLILFFTGLFSLFATGVSVASKYKSSSSVYSENQEFLVDSTEAIWQIKQEEFIDENFSDENIRMRFYSVQVKETSDSIGYIKIKSSARASNSGLANEYANKIDFNYVIENHKIILPRYFNLNTNHYYGQSVKVIIYMPEEIQFNANTLENIDYRYDNYNGSQRNLNLDIDNDGLNIVTDNVEIIANDEGLFISTENEEESSIDKD